ncbi:MULTISPECIES: DUF4097 family beta strand repeat-containing protein [Nocardioides]|uniref:DUF4097 family beta strand repeat-containing protein n=1 Tax=Nocardioides TaxID=1839 RepID=UPI00032E984A|nr:MULTISPECIES: DUF4097 family beta strand repeat-containing protein [Nocardioides]EON22567.1 hypothetical protein CF8_3538 [Nocardioides sp. CF8]
MQRTFETPQPIELYVESNAGLVTVTAADVARTEVTITGKHADEFVVEQRGDQVQVVGPRQRAGFLSGGNHTADVRVVMPARSALTVRTGSADTTVHGPIDGLWVNTGSGDVTAELVDGTTEVTSGSGDIRIVELRGTARIKSGSGDVAVTRCAELAISTGSGDVRIETVGGRLAVKTGSGDVQVGEAADDLSLSTGSGDLTVDVAHKGRYVVKGASGDVRIGVPAGTPVWTDITTISGRVQSDLTPVGAPAEGQDHLEIRATTASGDISLQQR